MTAVNDGPNCRRSVGPDREPGDRVPWLSVTLPLTTLASFNAALACTTGLTTTCTTVAVPRLADPLYHSGPRLDAIAGTNRTL